ncbi:dihydrofolate reductase family protein [Miniphocaeibacter massiliensis]|uniref:dihydrofolate reductase family protein n=1 Tax=Miniphocaeibacter massiliensis TaxID=2041841 RepID=UPI000C07ACB5|nr:dihydrofolate reductase family protein [Miniphocaeibacter massiliensis]
MSVIFYGCISLDGYLSGENHDLSWLYDSGDSEETDYENFYKNIDITIMGRNTFNEVNKIALFDKVYPSTINYVFTSRKDIKEEGVITVSENVNEFVKGIEKDKNVWVVGGSKIVSSLIKEDLIDRMYIQIAPVIIGGGILLFEKLEVQKRFKLMEVKKYGQFAGLIYEKMK